MDKIPLAKLQRDLMREFYSFAPTKAVYTKAEYYPVFQDVKNGREVRDFEDIELRVPAMANEIRRARKNSANLQSAIFSECVYTQTLANMFGLDEFCIFEQNPAVLSQSIKNLLASYFLTPRYIYKNNKRVLIQAGSCNGVDSALIEVVDNTIYTIEFKEQGAKIHEYDLPKYGEDGIIKLTDRFVKNHPNCTDMIGHFGCINIFENLGHNLRHYDQQSIIKAITDDYATTNRYANVVVTVDVNDNLFMIPTNQLGVFASIECEIRTCGRNHTNVYTPNKLKEIIISLDGKIVGNHVTIPLSALKQSTERGGNNKNRYKIGYIFFVYVKDCAERGDEISFNLSKVRQTRATVAPKAGFGNIEYDKIKSHFAEDLQ